ncbi:MAG: YbhB/YbcL family Raf kinase inhibitor-like protein [Candidatus Moranbacteria bacterium]|nr:YbhB/YbcL family Raf kinase inhibitor-like protein [Candidatus Moranbacteria bacterium]
MKLTSAAFKNGQAIPMTYSCDGDGASPPLEISEVPAGAESLVLMIDDPDAPGGKFIHWLFWNLKPEAQEIKKNKKPVDAIEGLNELGKHGFVKFCPPSGTHVYLFKLYALDTLLPPNSNLNKDQIRKLMEGHIIERVILRGYYERVQSESY